MPRGLDWNNKQVCLQQIAKSSACFAKLKDEFKDDKEIVMKAVRKNGELLKYVSSRLLRDPEITIEACKLGWHYLKYTTNEMKDNEHVVYTVCIKQGKALKYASDRLKNDKPFIFTLIKKKSGTECIQFAGKDILEDIEIAVQTLKINGGALRYFSDEIKDDYYLVSLAIKKNPECFHLASERLRGDKELINTILKKLVKFEGIFQDFSKELKEDKEFIIQLINNGVDIYDYLTPEVRIDEYICRASITMFHNMHHLKCPALQDDFDFVCELVSNPQTMHVKRNYHYISERLRNDDRINNACIHC
jgi:hypothetical protein